MSNQLNFFDSLNAISSPELAAGALLSSSPDGPRICLSGRGVALVSRSLSLGNRKELPTSATCGLPSESLSEAHRLQSCLGSRLRHRLGGNGITMEYALTWKIWDTPQGAPICALRASKRPTCGKGFTGWVSPTAQDGSPMAGSPATEAYNEAGNNDSSRKTVELVGWPSPKTPTGGANSNRENRLATGGPDLQEVAGWATPRAEDAESAGMRHARGVADTLSAQAGQDLVGWSTPIKGDGKMRISNPEMAAKRAATGKQSSLEMEAHGAISMSSPAEMEKRGALNPAHSRWLMGFPVAWDSCGATAMQSCRRLPRNSSKRPKKPSK
jgi:hypothetical protein